MPITTSIKRIKGGVCAPRGFQAAAVSAGIKNPNYPRLDLALIYSPHPCTAAGTFTTNRVKAAPVKVSQAYLKADKVQAIVANSGNANACTGMQGLGDARMGVGQLVEFDPVELHACQERVGGGFAQIRKQLLVRLIGEGAHIDIEGIGQREQDTRGDRSLIALQQVEIARRDAQCRRGFCLGEAAFAPEAAEAGAGEDFLEGL